MSVLVSKNIPSTVSMFGKQASDFVEGDIVKLNENGVATEFYIAKHSYEFDLNGAGRILLVRKAVHSTMYWHTKAGDEYDGCGVDVWLNDTYKQSLDSEVQDAIGSTTFKYANADDEVLNLSRSVFLLSATELGLTGSATNIEGSKLPIQSTLLIATNSSGTATTQWTRSPRKGYSTIRYVTSDGTISYESRDNKYGVRPCLTLPYNARFDEKTLLFKGVK